MVFILIGYTLLGIFFKAVMRGNSSLVSTLIRAWPTITVVCYVPFLPTKANSFIRFDEGYKPVKLII